MLYGSHRLVLGGAGTGGDFRVKSELQVRALAEGKGSSSGGAFCRSAGCYRLAAPDKGI